MTRPSWQDFGTHDESIVPELWDGVVGAWAPCLGPTGLRLHDMSRRSNWGTLTGLTASAWELNAGHYSLRSAGRTETSAIVVSAATPGQPDLQSASTRSYTMSAWIYFETGTVSTYPTAMAYGRFQASLGVRQVGLSPVIECWRNNSVNQLGVTAIVPSRWTHIAVVSAASGISDAVQIFCDGKLDSTTTEVPLVTSAQGFNLAAVQGSNLNNSWSGLIDDMLVWSRALPEGQIRQLYQLGRGGMYQRRRRSRIYIPQAGFQAAWARRQNQIIGGGL